MVYLYRVILIFLISCSAHALSYDWKASVAGLTCAVEGGVNGAYYASPDAGFSATTAVCGTANFEYVPPNSANQAFACYVPGCSSNVTFTLQSSCPSGQERNASGACVVPPPPPPPVCPTGILFGGAPRTVVDTGGANTSCVAGCVVSCTGTCVGATGARSYTYGTTWTSTGETCTGSPTTQPTVCPAGQTPGEFNGATICLPSAPPDTAKTDTKKTQTTLNPDGSTTVTTTTATTTCGGDGACTTNTTIVTNNFAPGVPTTGVPTSTSAKTDTKQEPKISFCEENPESVICKKLNSTFGGGCGGFSCDGDAIQCAIAQDQHKRNCQLFDTSTTLSDLGNKVTSGVDDFGSLSGDAAIVGPAQRTNINLPGTLSASKVLPGGCIPDKSFTLWGGTNFTLPFSSLCPYLRMMGLVVLAFAYLSASRIVGAV